MFSQLLPADQFLPHGMCRLWFPELLALPAGADALIVLSYYAIPAALGYFVLRRGDVLYSWVFVLLTSGYPDAVLEHGSTEETYGKLLPKPYQLAELAGAIPSKLDAAA